LNKIKKSKFYKRNRKKTLRYLRWGIKATFLITFVVPIFYLANFQELSVNSFFFVKPTGQISGFTTIQEFFMVPIGQSPDAMWLSYYGNANPGYFIVEPFGGLQVLLTGQIEPHLLFFTIVAILIFVSITILIGNVFCSWSCPVGTVIDSFDSGIGKFFPKIETEREKRSQQRIEKERKQNKQGNNLGCSLCPLHRMNGKWAKGILVSSLVGSAIFKFPVFCAICPIGIITRGLFHFKAMMTITGTWMVWWLEMLLVPIGATILSLRERRFFCKRICPVGSFLSWIGALNPFIKPKVNEEKCVMKVCPEDCKDNQIDMCYACRILDDYKCEKVCPVDIELVNHGSLAKCTKCLECYIVCPYNAISIDLSGKPDAVQSSSRFLNRIRKRSSSK
jgi:ferredoxin-type protein NapH